MTAIHPERIEGAWDSGFALDYHTVSSVFIGHDAYGHPMFETEYTELGALVYRLKSQKDRSVVAGIIETVVQFVTTTWNPGFSVIVPVPPSNVRAEQPVALLAGALAERLKLPIRSAAVTKLRRTEQLKNVNDYAERMRILEGNFSADPNVVSTQKVLLFDDLYRSGATMNSVARALREIGQAAEIHALALTRTRVHR